MQEVKVKINYLCINCGRKATITYDRKCNGGGLWISKTNTPCLPFMQCPRCKKIAMKEIGKVPEEKSEVK